MYHKHVCPDCGERKTCTLPDCMFDPSDESQCDDCADRAASIARRRERTDSDAREGGR